MFCNAVEKEKLSALIKIVKKSFDGGMAGDMQLIKVVLTMLGVFCSRGWRSSADNTQLNT